MAEVSLVKLPSYECQWTIFMVSQHWFWQWLGAVRQQAITWANVDPDLCLHMVSLGHNELSYQVWHVLFQIISRYLCFLLTFLIYKMEKMIPQNLSTLSVSLISESGHQGLLLLSWDTFDQIWIINHMTSNVGNEITYPFPYFNVQQLKFGNG